MVSIGGGSVGGIIRTNKTKRILKVIKNVGQQYHESFIIKKVGNKISKTLKKYHSGLTVEEKEVKTKKRLLTRESWTEEEKEEYSHKMSESAKRHRAEAPPEYWK